MAGREVAVLVNGKKERGTHSVTFDASYLASGMYLVHLQTGNNLYTKKITLLK